MKKFLFLLLPICAFGQTITVLPSKDTTVITITRKVIPTITPNPGRQNIIFQDLDGTAKWDVVGTSTAHGITTALIAGKQARRFEVRKTDPEFAGGVRAELNRYSDQQDYPYEVWYGMSYYVPADWVNDNPLLNTVVNQWHDEGGVLKSPFDFNISGSNWLYNTRSSIGETQAIVTPIEKGRWTDFVFHLKFAKFGNGLVEIWKNGIRMISQTPAMGYSTAVLLPFFKMGIYNWAWNPGSGQTTTSTQHILYISNFRLGNSKATYEDVKP